MEKKTLGKNHQTFHHQKLRTKLLIKNRWQNRTNEPQRTFTSSLKKRLTAGQIQGKEKQKMQTHRQAQTDRETDRQGGTHEDPPRVRVPCGTGAGTDRQTDKQSESIDN